MRGYFAVGCEGISKSYNLGNLVRTSHSFGASFFFTINSELDYDAIRTSDTAHSDIHMPFYAYNNLEEFTLPKDCALVGVEFMDDSVDMPSFRHPMRAAYVLGRKRPVFSRSGQTLRPHHQDPHEVLRQCWRRGRFVHL